MPRTDKPKRLRFHRRPLALPYATPPAAGELHLSPVLHTAAELAADAQHHTAA